MLDGAALNGNVPATVSPLNEPDIATKENDFPAPVPTSSAVNCPESAEVTCGQGRNSARERYCLRIAEAPFAVAGENSKRIPALRCNHQVLIAISLEIAQSDEVRRKRQREDIGIRQKRRRELAAADGLQCSVALWSESVKIAALHGDHAAARRPITNQKVIHAIPIDIPGGHCNWLRRPCHYARRRTGMGNRQTLVVLQPELGPARSLQASRKQITSQSSQNEEQNKQRGGLNFGDNTGAHRQRRSSHG